MVATTEDVVKPFDEDTHGRVEEELVEIVHGATIG